MHRFQVPLACFALLRSLSPAARLMGVIGAALLMCSCSGGSSSGGATPSPGAAITSPSTATTSPSTTTTSPGATEGSPGVANASAGQAHLAWDPVSTPDLVGYRLYYGQTAQTYASHIDVGAQTTYTVTGLAAGQTYYFAVTAYDHLGKESPFSNEVSTSITATAAVGVARANLTSGQAPLPVAFTHTSTGTSKGLQRLGKAPHPVIKPLPEGRGAVKLAPLRRHSRGERAKTPSADTVAEEGKEATSQNQLDKVLEVGELTVDDLWQRVTFRRPFVDPIVVATPLSANDLAPATIRIRNVEPTGFEIRVQTWDDLDGSHAPETVSYLAMERGPHLLGTGIRVEAGRLTTPANPTQPFTPVTLRQAFGVAPVLLTAVTSINDAAAVTVRVRNVTAQSLQVRLQEPIGKAPNQTTETIDYIAWEPSSGTVDDLTFEVHTTPNAVTDTMYTLRLMERFLAIPMFLAAMQTINGEAPAILRWDNKDPVSVEIQIQGEASASHDLRRPTEVVGYMAFTYQVGGWR